MNGPAYWIIAVVLVGFGFVGIFSIGLPFLAVGVSMILLTPLRKRRTVFWPIMAGLVAFLLSWWLTAPAACKTIVTVSRGVGDRSSTSTAGDTTCTALIGIEYATPNHWPSLATATVTAGVAAGLAYRTAQGAR